MKILVTGGCGFIGSAVVRHFVLEKGAEVVNLDCVSYAAAPGALAEVEDTSSYYFIKANICDAPAVRRAFERHSPDAVMHLAAESHVDRSIDGPEAFVQSNIVGTSTLLQEATRYFRQLPTDKRAVFRFHHVSTDEVFGSLGPYGAFTEETPYDPRSPYAASKASADHLVRAWHHTYGLPIVISNCSNNFGPWQYPEKLMPVVLMKAIASKPIPVYGTGSNIRDWLFVDDHADALFTILTKGRIGQSYNVGANNERTNMEVVRALCAELDRQVPTDTPHADLITFVQDRPGHDMRYAIDAQKIHRELQWNAQTLFEDGIRQTVAWYLHNMEWCRSLIQRNSAGQRLGLAPHA